MILFDEEADIIECYSDGMLVGTIELCDRGYYLYWRDCNHKLSNIECAQITQKCVELNRGE